MIGEFLPKRSEKITGGQNTTKGKRREDRDKKKEMLGKEKRQRWVEKKGVGAFGFLEDDNHAQEQILTASTAHAEMF